MYANSPAGEATRKPVTLTKLAQMRAAAEPIAMLTCYDASFAAVFDAAGVHSLLVGDSLGMVVQGHGSTLPVTLADIAYHTAAVARGNRHAWLIADMPFGTYQSSLAAAYDNAARLMQAGAQMVKVEGGEWLAPTVEMMAKRSIPVCAHLGLTPQSVHALGGYRVQGKTIEAAEQLKRDALALQAAGASLLVLEMVPAALAAELTELLAIPTIGIGAGNRCSGQVLVLHDMIGVYPGRVPKFAKNFMDGQPSVLAAAQAYVAAVQSRTFPGAEHSY